MLRNVIELKLTWVWLVWSMDPLAILSGLDKWGWFGIWIGWSILIFDSCGQFGNWWVASLFGSCVCFIYSLDMCRWFSVQMILIELDIDACGWFWMEMRSIWNLIGWGLAWSLGMMRWGWKLIGCGWFWT